MVRLCQPASPTPSNRQIVIPHQLTGQSTSRSRYSEEATFWQSYPFFSNAQFKVTLIVTHARVEMNCEHIFVVLNFGTDGEWFVPEVPQTACELLSSAIILVIIRLKTIVDHCHYVWVVVFVVIIK